MMHDAPGVLGFQKVEIGLHWKRRKNKKKIPKTALTPIVSQMIWMCRRCTAIRRRKSPIAILRMVVPSA